MQKFTFKSETNPITSPVGPESWCGKYGSQFKKKFRYFVEISFTGERPIHVSVITCLPWAQTNNFIQSELQQYHRDGYVTLIDTVEYTSWNHRCWHELYSLDELIAYIDHMFPERWTVNVPPILGSDYRTKTFLSRDEADKYAKEVRENAIIITKR